MKQSNILFAIGAALLMAGCSADDERTSYGTGRLDFAVTASADVANVTSRAPEGYVELPTNVVPPAGNLKLTLTGTYKDHDGNPGTLNESWDRFSSYDPENFPLECSESNYTATFTYGDDSREGADAAFFRGEVTGIQLTPDTTTEKEVLVVLANSCFRLQLDETMTNYYSNLNLTVKTENGGSFNFTPATLQNIIFVKAGQTLTLSGSANHAASGQSVTFGPQVLNAGNPTRATTMHTITLKAEGVGSTKIVVSFDDTFKPIEGEVYI